ncbi:TPA: hypothetical protein TZE22_000808 [Streptococcus suis]|nr:hypothetical protein [Streptococcus suis]HEM5167015.1 hypothetical protein [Streptococcus suis]HEM5178178.1 hypothetical protein [Streptococcus suis]
MVVPKFRAWFGSKMYDEPVVYNGEVYLDWRDFEDWKIYDDAVLMQSTGLLDKNGKEIFEGHLVQWEHVETRKIIEGIVKYDTELGFWGMTDKRFKADDLTAIGYIANQAVEIIGNIWEGSDSIDLNNPATD